MNLTVQHTVDVNKGPSAGIICVYMHIRVCMYLFII